MDFNKISTPVAIVIGCSVLAASFYFVQIDKRKSIEKQQEQERLDSIQEAITKKQSEEISKENEKIKMEQDRCQSLASGVKAKWNNVMGVTYSELYGDCVVTYTDTKTGEVTTAPLDAMKSTY